MLVMETAEGDDMRAFHDRQPIALDREGARTWLDLSADFNPILIAPPAGANAENPPEPVAT